MKLIHPLEGFTHFGNEFLSPILNGFHPGADYNKGAPWEDLGAPVLAIADGEVVFSEYRSDWGNLVVLWHKELKKWSRYGHNRAVFINMGEDVKQGHIIAEVGNEGASTAPHLHADLIKKELPNGWASYVRNWSKDKIREYYDDIVQVIRDSQRDLSGSQEVQSGVMKTISSAWEILEALPAEERIDTAQKYLNFANRTLKGEDISKDDLLSMTK